MKPFPSMRAQRSNPGATSPRITPGFLRCARNDGFILALRSLFLCATLSACALGPKYQRPTLDAPRKFTATDQQEAWPAPVWWRGFGSPELDALETAAQAYNTDLAAAAAASSRPTPRSASAARPCCPPSAAPPISITSAPAARAAAPPASASPAATATSTAAPTASASTPATTLISGAVTAPLAQAAQASAVASRFDAQTVALSVVHLGRANLLPAPRRPGPPARGRAQSGRRRAHPRRLPRPPSASAPPTRSTSRNRKPWSPGSAPTYPISATRSSSSASASHPHRPPARAPGRDRRLARQAAAAAGLPRPAERPAGPPARRGQCRGATRGAER